MKSIKIALLTILAGLVFVGTTSADTDVTFNITTSETWTPAGNPYHLKDHIYIEPGASLTIEAGVIVKSSNNTGTGESGVAGSLIVTRDADIYIMGTEENPVVMTSTSETGSWRPTCFEWGNLAILGKGLISASHFDGAPVSPAIGGGNNPVQPTGTAQYQLEGLTDPDEDLTHYGGDDDNDDSGEIHYLSLRYGGLVVGEANELNGLSLGGVGRGTEIDHVEIMNNVDDGIEIWGGTVNLKYVSIWNVGDDSFDFDQGWRGKAQFGLIVQGYCAERKQGSGVGDNCFEHDGAENETAQPVSTASIYNFTVVGNWKSGDGAIAWRDNARVQYRNCIFMDIGEKVVRFDDESDHGAMGYSGEANGSRTTSDDGTLTWVEHWQTSYDMSHDWDHAKTVNEYNEGGTEPDEDDFRHPLMLYQAQTSGYLCEISDCVFYANDHADAYTEAETSEIDLFNDHGTWDKHNVKEPANMPIVSITRGAKVTVPPEDHDVYPVTYLDPRAANDATDAHATAPADGFFTPVDFRGGFSPSHNWIEGWTAAYEYGFTTDSNGDHPDLSDPKVETEFEFETENGVLYTIEKSSDMRNWVPVQVIEGTGDTMTSTDLDSYDATKFYRAIRQ